MDAQRNLMLEKNIWWKVFSVLQMWRAHRFACDN